MPFLLPYIVCSSGLTDRYTCSGTDLPSYFTEGIPNWFQNLPTGTQVLSRLGIDDGDLAAQPTQVLNIPPYANWTDQGWNVRFHGNVYKQPNSK